MAQADTVTKDPGDRKVSAENRAQRSGADRWILGPWADCLLIIGSPALIYLLITWARGATDAQTVSAFVMIWAIGHHLPGMMRAYGDSALFSQYRVRFVLAPLLLLTASSFAFLTGVTAGLMALTAVWGWWHYLMQAYGFARIYDAKLGIFDPWTRHLDRAMCLAWFAAAVLLNDNALYGFVQNFYNAGLPVPSPVVVHLLQQITSGATAAISLLFVIHAVRRWRAGERISGIKIVLMATTFAYFWYSDANVTNIVVAYAFFELFHDVQYLTIVWAFNQNRVAKDPSVGKFSSFLFRTRFAMVLLYLGLIVAYGATRYFGELYTRQTQATLHQVILAVFLTSTLLHYYFDGFIWKLKDRKTQESLQITTASAAHSGPIRRVIPGGLRHALLWSLFLLPFVVMLFTQVGDALGRREMPDDRAAARRVDEMRRLVEIAPRSVMAQYTLGLAYEGTGQWERALEAYRAALRIYPHHDPSRRAIVRITRRRNPSP